MVGGDQPRMFMNSEPPVKVQFEAQLKDEQYFDVKITLHCRYQIISSEILECLNEGEMDALTQQTPFGDLIRCGRDFNISNQIIWYMTIRQYNVTNSNELWMVVNGRPLRFSKMEFALLTGLRFSSNKPPFPESEEFRRQHFRGIAAVKCNDILERMWLLKRKKRNHRSVSTSLVQLAALYFVCGVLCPSWHSKDSVDNKILTLASNWETFASYPWGNMSYDLLIQNLKKDMRAKEQKIRKGGSGTHSIGGFAHPFQILAYECIPGIAMKYAERRLGEGLPLARMCRWSSRMWNQKKCPKYSAIRAAAETSEDIISCLTPTEDESTAAYIRDGDFNDECPDPITEHISQMLTSGIKVFCTTNSASPSHQRPHPSPSQQSPPPSPSQQSPPPSPSHQSPISHPSPPPSHPSPSPPSSHRSPPPSHTHPHSHPSASTSSSIELHELFKYIESKFESMDSKWELKFESMDARLVKMDSKIQTICDYVEQEQKKTTQPLKRPLNARDEVVKRRRQYIDTYEEIDEGVAEPSHVEQTPMTTAVNKVSVPVKRVSKPSKFLETPFTGPGTDTPITKKGNEATEYEMHKWVSSIVYQKKACAFEEHDQQWFNDLKTDARWLDGDSIHSRESIISGPSALKHVGQNSPLVVSRDDVQNRAPIQQADSIVNCFKKLQDDMQELGQKIKHHDDNVKYLKSLKNKLEESILDMQVAIGKYYTRSSSTENEDLAHTRSEEETIQNILKHEKSAAALLCWIKSQPEAQGSCRLLTKDVVGIVATLGKVDDDNLSRLLSEYLGLDTMLAVVCRTYEGVTALEAYNREGLINKSLGLHALGASNGRPLDDRFIVICLEKLRPYSGEFIADDPQQRLDLQKPKLLDGEIPPGFLGFAVNMITIDSSNLNGISNNGCSLRETLFYNLFTNLQVYRSREDMLKALSCITNGAISLDGGIIKGAAVFSLGLYREANVDVMFPNGSDRVNLPDSYFEIENHMKETVWKKTRTLEDMQREQTLLDHARYNYEIKKREFVQFLAESSSFAAQYQVGRVLTPR